MKLIVGSSRDDRRSGHLGCVDDRAIARHRLHELLHHPCQVQHVAGQSVSPRTVHVDSEQTRGARGARLAASQSTTVIDIFRPNWLFSSLLFFFLLFSFSRCFPAFQTHTHHSFFNFVTTRVDRSCQSQHAIRLYSSAPRSFICYSLLVVSLR